MTASHLRATPREGRPAPPTKLYTYRGAKTEARARHFAALERHSAECLQRSHEQAKSPAPAPEPKPKPEPARPALPPPLYGGPEGLEEAAAEIAAHSRNAPKSEWPELPAPPAQEGETPHEIPHPDTHPLRAQDARRPAPAQRHNCHNTPLRSGKSRARRLLGWASESFHAGARAFREARLEGSQGRG